METCVNCERQIGSVEKSYAWRGKVTCEGCHRGLSAHARAKSHDSTTTFEGFLESMCVLAGIVCLIAAVVGPFLGSQGSWVTVALLWFAVGALIEINAHVRYIAAHSVGKQ